MQKRRERYSLTDNDAVASQSSSATLGVCGWGACEEGVWQCAWLEHSPRPPPPLRHLPPRRVDRAHSASPASAQGAEPSVSARRGGVGAVADSRRSSLVLPSCSRGTCRSRGGSRRASPPRCPPPPAPWPSSKSPPLQRTVSFTCGNDTNNFLSYVQTSRQPWNATSRSPVSIAR